MFKEIFIIIVLLILVLAAIFLTLKSMVSGGKKSKSSGKNEKEFVTNIIGEILDVDDTCLAEVELDDHGRSIEFDNIVINRYGVFIIEARRLKGELNGRENDEIWIRQATNKAGDLIENEVRNPIVQVKRKIDDLTEFLEDNGISVWVEGYVYLVHKNSPVDCKHILWNRQDMEYAIHPDSKYQLSSKQVKRIEKLLE